VVFAFFAAAAVLFLAIAALAPVWPPVLWSLIVLVPVFALGVYDALQTRRAVLRNFPVVGHFRYLFELVRPEINQYFVESNTDGKPFSREQRSIVYQRAKKELQTLPFGTQRDVYAPGYEWINHSFVAQPPLERPPRITIGLETCAHPYDAALLNVSAMSFGSLSNAAIRALNGGAKLGGFYHNTGEGGLSPHHREPGGDLVWQIGTGYFGCRAPDGRFSPERFQETAACPTVRMIEVKLSQGAKPGHGGILPGAKVTAEIAAIRGVPVGETVFSPPAHTAFGDPRGLLRFVAELRELSGGRPVGIKLCVGSPSELLGLCKAMRETNQVPDFISVDGGEGGTGAAPLEFSNSVGSPLTDGLVLVHNALVGFGLRERLTLIASGKIVNGFEMVRRLAAGADLCASARGFMFSLGCIQALRCNSNECPVGVATQNPSLVRGLVVADKVRRVASFQHETVHAFLELLGAAGLGHPDDLGPWHVHRRISPTQVKSYAEIYRWLANGALLSPPFPPEYTAWMDMSSADAFAHLCPVAGPNAGPPVEAGV
jgi:glutamate synthase domain-containing protein 2